MGIFVALRGALKGSKVAKALKGFDTITPQPAIFLDDTGFGVALDPSDTDLVTPVLPWSDIVRVWAFKRDLFAVDLVCLRFEANGDRAYEVNEEMAGWTELVAALPERIPGSLSREAILDMVVLPAFATKEVLVFERQVP
jgi:hypothetical protein